MEAPYGSWKSPVTSDLIVSKSIRLGRILLDGEDIYWLESRPMEGGRNVVVRRTSDGRIIDTTPSPYNARTRVHEYGGGEYTVGNGCIYFSNFGDQRLYRHYPGSEPVPVTPEAEFRYVDGVFDRYRNRMIYVREDHTIPDREPVNTLVTLDPEGRSEGEVIVSGNDFYGSPRISPDGSHLAWLTWNHPNMPWDGTELWIAEIKPDGSLERAQHVAGNVDESIFQPEWSPDGTLYFVSDRTGWWNLHRWREAKIEQVVQMEAEFGMPQWIFGMSTYAFESEDRMICCYSTKGIWHLASVDTRSGKFTDIECPHTSIACLRAFDNNAVFIGGSPQEPPSVVMLDLANHTLSVLRRSSEIKVDPGYLSTPKAITFPSQDGGSAHAFFYTPKNRDCKAPADERPPLITMSHGGPTSATSSTLRLDIQYWTSRGFAVLDVNYRGSTGYGREYRKLLEGQWGVADVDDCVSGAEHLAGRGEVDRNRLVIRGGSAGGFTTLCALTFRGIFKAGASYYGISDLEALAKESHKFESRYSDRLVGPYPEKSDLYRQRSPIHFVSRLSCPVIFFQGLEDKVVPPNQAQMMVKALDAKKLPVAYLAFEGEQHGFRRAETIKRALDAELYFYSRILGFELADPIEPVPIKNL